MRLLARSWEEVRFSPGIAVCQDNVNLELLTGGLPSAESSTPGGREHKEGERRQGEGEGERENFCGFMAGSDHLELTVPEIYPGLVS